VPLSIFLRHDSLLVTEQLFRAHQDSVE
jgi:hypothetical protein